MTSYEIKPPPLGGLSSQIHMGLCILLQSVTNIYDIKQFKYKLTSDLFNSDLFDKIYQYDDDNYTTLQNDNMTMLYSNYIDLYNTQKNFKEANYLINLNKLRSNIQLIIDEYLIKQNITENTLGVHIRLTDMNKIHNKNHGIKTYEDFLEKIKVVLDEDKSINNIFISSDNYESINKLIIDIPNVKINYIVDILRCDNEESDNLKLQMDNLKDDNYVINSFIDMYLLSKCGYLIHRISGFALCSILYSNTHKKTYIL